jgi:hypothetical protein
LSERISESLESTAFGEDRSTLDKEVNAQEAPDLEKEEL